MNVQSAESCSPNPLPIANQAAPAHLCRLVLTGFMGAGKTTIGQLLANRIDWDFLDLDAHIEARTGLAVPSIFALHGEPHFRKLESEALASALGRRNVVLALGGGTPEILTNRLLLEQTPKTTTIFLDAPFAVLYDRCLAQANYSSDASSTAAVNPAHTRPNLADPALAEARFRVRQPLYRRLAQHTLDTSSLTAEQAVAALLGRLNAPRSKRP